MSVVVPTLGRETVVRTVETLLAARGGEELDIVVAGRVGDAGVKGQLERLCREHPNVRHLEVQWETGDSSRKKNAGAEAASGDIVAFLDDDVEVAEDWPEKMRAAFAEEGVGLASGPGLVPDGLNTVGRMAGLALSSGAAGYVARRYAGGGDGGAVAAGWDD
ncbi:MAG: glycosyltransferase family 2 protein, partial [Kiritimatiellae bacterium]|nr:glycosyltransferase family 2 protein [Kiritimatiellia bacterium]